LKHGAKARPPAMDDVHFHTRYVVLDIACSGVNPETDKLLSIILCGKRQFCRKMHDLAAQGGDIATTLESSRSQQLMEEIDTAAQLVDESKASNLLRRNH
jgi:hypothetical protein